MHGEQLCLLQHHARDAWCNQLTSQQCAAAAHLVALHGGQQRVALLGGAPSPDAQDAVSARTDDAGAVCGALDARHLRQVLGD